MSDYFRLETGQSIVSETENWYKNVQQLGTGGNATTSLVLATSGVNKGILFALKVFRRRSLPRRRQRFLEEVAFLETCSHPSIMRIYDKGVYSNDNPFLVAEYLPQRLRDVMRGGSCTLPEKVSYAMQLCSALNYLSSLKPPIVHRDIKPENIFVKGRSCVLGDFGLLKRLNGIDEAEDRQILIESSGPGMPFYYRTPELVAYAQGQSPITPKSDVFQLGLVLTELFTGRNPLKPAENITDAVQLDHIGNIHSGFGAGVAGLLMRMLIIDAVERPDGGSLLDPWQGVFKSVSEAAIALNGRVL